MTEIHMTDLYEYRGIAWQDLHPIARMQFQEMAENLTQAFTGGAIKQWFRPHMGYRSPAVQDGLYAQGRTKQGAVVTKAQGWESAHQFGLAVDFVPWETLTKPTNRDADERSETLPLGHKGRFVWAENAEWKKLASRAELVGLRCPIAWDRPHVEHPAWDVLRKRIRGG